MNNFVTLNLIRELRKKVGASILDCKNALLYSKGDTKLAIEYMRKAGQIKLLKRSVYPTSQGLILIKLDQRKENGIIIEINCETDFTLKSSTFLIFCKKIINEALNNRIIEVDILRKKFEKERIELANNLNENIIIRRLNFLKGKRINSYLHNKRIGVILSSIGGNDEQIRQIAMHIASSNPKYIKKENIPNNLIDKEREIQFSIAMKYNKSKDIVNKIVEGRIKKFVDQISLSDQLFIMNTDKKVGQILQEKKIKIEKFIRFELNENTIQ